MKKHLCILLSCILIVSGITSGVSIKSSAQSSGKSGDLSWNVTEGILKISGNGKMTDGDAPWGNSIIEVIIEEGVESIGEKAFLNCTALKNASIAGSVKSIGSEAFFGCSKLSEIKIPDSVTYIGSEAFSDCTNLCSLEFSSGLEQIEGFAFYECQSLKSLKLPSSLKSIGENAFSMCSELEEIEMETGCENYYSIDNCLISYDNKTLILGCKNSVIPSDGSVTQIGNSAFYGAEELKSITIPESIKR